MARLLEEAREKTRREEHAQKENQYFEENITTIREEVIKYLLKYIDENKVEEDEIYDFTFTPSGLSFILCEFKGDLEFLRSRGLKVKLECAPLRHYKSHIWLGCLTRENVNDALAEFRRYQ